VSFDWMTPKRAPVGAPEPDKRIAMYHREIKVRAGIFYRLGYTQQQACERLRANADWDFEVGTGERPKELDGDAIDTIVAATYARRPAH
jgi:hypothetical protein